MKINSFLFCAILAIANCHAWAEPPTPAADLYKTLNAAAMDHKMAFILLGRSTCGICNATRSMIRKGKIPVTDADYVMADLDIDNPRLEAEFMRRFAGVRFGDSLPLVVVTDSQGKVLASSSGYRNEHQWTGLLNQAKSKAAANSHSGDPSDPGATNSDWPFKSPAP